MSGFPTKTLNTIKRILLRKEKEVEKTLKEVEQEDPVKSPSLAESSEPGTDSYIADTHTKDVVLEDQLKKASTSIKQTLGKIRKGTYGKCEKCGRQIEIGRLLAMPTASFCLVCSKKAIKP